MKLYYKKMGEGCPVFILHGLFGSSDNWFAIAKMLANHYTVYLPDQRNHGRSPHSSEWNYTAMASDIKNLAAEEGLKEIWVLGHSMGGKVAMELATKYPDWLRKIMVLDIGPKEYPVRHRYIIDGLKSIDLNSISKRSEADAQLSNYIDSFHVRQFLLKNLERNNNGDFRWKINLPVIDAKIEEAGKPQIPENPVENEILFVRGSNSNYILDSDEKQILEFFPNATFETIPNVGHWMHAEQPEAVMQSVKRFFDC
jgi:pimeloyl-ACP methyl ester carboxylesterase